MGPLLLVCLSDRCQPPLHPSLHISLGSSRCPRTLESSTYLVSQDAERLSEADQEANKRNKVEEEKEEEEKEVEKKEDEESEKQEENLVSNDLNEVECEEEERLLQKKVN